MDLDYARDTVDDPTFNGIVVGCPEVCRIHKLPPRKCVAFEGVNTGRKFYIYQVENASNLLLCLFSCRFGSIDEWRY
jgi:NAD-dependent dihydropyrimidine dehydrogenase PreA subunit